MGIVVVMLAAGWFAQGPLGAEAAGMHEPIEQITDKLENEAHQQLAGLYATALEADEFELSWIVITLPCPSQHIRLKMTTAQIAATQASSGEVEISILSAQLPRNVPCGSGLPSEADEGSATLTVSRVAEGHSIAAPNITYADEETKILSFTTCVTLADACRGRYVLRAYLKAPRRTVRLEYVFRVAPVSDHPDPEQNELLGGALPIVMGEAAPCPVH